LIFKRLNNKTEAITAGINQPAAGATQAASYLHPVINKWLAKSVMESYSIHTSYLNKLLFATPTTIFIPLRKTMLE
jgi:hypothetical protein